MGLLLLQGSAALNPRELFASGEQGLWLDPSQMSTMYQDSNGVTPCTAAGDPVGLIIDQSRGGLGALGSELVTNGGFDADSDWTKGTGWTISGGKADYTSGGGVLRQDIASIAGGKWYRVTATVTVSGGTTFRIYLGNISAINLNTTVSVSGTYSWFVFALSVDKSFGFSGAGAGPAFSIDNVSIREVPGNHAYQTTSAARPTLQTSGGLWYLSFDGSDDSLVTNAVDMTGTAQMTVIAGVRKLSDAVRGTVVELSASWQSNNGTFGIEAPEGTPGTGYRFVSKGTSSDSQTPTPFTAPLTRVLTLSADISSPSLIARVNSSVVATSTASQGTGNFGNHVVWIGRRGGTDLPFNGHIYQLIVRGRTTPTGKLLEAERFVARRTGVSF